MTFHVKHHPPWWAPWLVSLLLTAGGVACLVMGETATGWGLVGAGAGVPIGKGYLHLRTRREA